MHRETGGSRVSIGALFLAALIIVTGLFSKTPALQPLVVLTAVVGVVSIFRMRGNAFVVTAASVFVVFTATAFLISLFEASSREYVARGTLTLLYPIFCAVAAARIWRDASSGSRLLVYIALGVTVVGNVLVALRQAIFGLSASEVAAAVEAQSTYLVGEQVRLMSTYATNQDFGLFLSVSLPATLAVALVAKSRRLRVVAWVGALTIAVVIVLSLTRTALVAAAVSAFVLIFFWARGSATTRILKGGVSLALVGGLGVLVFSAADQRRFQDAVTRVSTLFDLYTDKSFNARSDIVYPRAIAAIEESPILGYGLGSAGPVAQQFPTVAPLGEFTTDNGYLMFGVQIGVLGAIALVLLLLAAMVATRRGRTATSIAAAAVILSLLVAMFFAQYWSLLAPITFAAVVVGLGLADAGCMKKRDPGSELVTFSRRSLAGVVSRV